MIKYLVSEYYHEDDLLSVLSTKEYSNFNKIIQMVCTRYPGIKHYMTLSEGDDKYIIRFNENDKICFLIEEI